MKLNKRVTALILAVAMAFSSPCTASAAVQNTEPIVIADSGRPQPTWNVGDDAYGGVINDVEWDSEINNYWYYSNIGVWRGDMCWHPTPNTIDSGNITGIRPAPPQKVPPLVKTPQPKAGETWQLVTEFDTSQTWTAASAGRYQISVYGPGGRGGSGGSKPSSKANMTDGGGGGSSGGYATVIVDLPAGGWVKSVTSSTQNVVTTSAGHSWTLTQGSNGTRGGSNSVGLGATVVGQPGGVVGRNGEHNPMVGGGSCDAPNCPYNDGHYHICGGGSGYDYLWFDHSGGDGGDGGALPHPAYSKNKYGDGGNGGSGGRWEYSRWPGEKTINKGFAGEAGDTGNEGGVIIGKMDFTAPTTGKTINKNTNTATITGSSPAATSMEVTGNGLSGQVSGSSISKPTMKNGTYQVVARSGSASLSTPIAVSELDNTASANAYAAPSPTGWAQSKTTTITITDATTSGIQYSLNGGAWTNYTAPIKHTFTANGSITVQSRDKWGYTSGVTTITASQIDTTPPTAPTVTKSPAAAWHNNNVTVTVNGGGDAQSGVNRYQYSINGGAWTNYTAPFIVSATSTINARTVDNVGLASGGTGISINIDRAAPTGTISYDKAWTNNPLELSFTASDLGGSGIAKVRPAGGTWVSGGSAKQTISANGTYSFESTDNAGNTSVTSVTVGNIDKALPVVDEINFIKTSDSLFRMLFNKQVEISIVTSDNTSGVASVEYQLVPEGGNIDGSAWLTYSAASKPRVAQRFHGAVAARCADVAANISAVKQEEVTVENTPPTASHTLSVYDWTNEPVTITVTALDDLSGVDNISLPDGTVVQGNTAQYTAPQNGKYSFIVTDKCGNAFTYDVDIGNIDLTPATAAHTLSPGDFTNTDVVITVTAEDEESGVKSTTLPDGSVIDGEIASLTVSKNDTFSFIVTNVVGITTKYDVQVSNTDYVPPEITGFALREVEENPVRKFLRGVFPAMFAKQVDLLVTAEDDYSGINTIEYQVADRGAPLQDSGWRVCGSGKPPRLAEEMDATVAVRTTDNAGNISAIVSKDAVIDGSSPIGSHTLSTTDWVRTYIDISVAAKDKWTKAAYITLPNGKMVNGDAAVFRAVRNGDYPFILTDELGNSGVYTVTIGNIDYVQPEITGFALREVEENPVRKFLRGVFPAMFAKQVELLVTAEDDYSGIKIIEYQVTDKGAPLQDSGWRICDSGKPPRLAEEMDATVAVRTTDNAGNISAIVSKDAVIDGSAPIGSHTLSTTDWVRTYIDISVAAKDKWTKAAYITMPDGKMVNGDAAVFRAVRNGDYPFILTDELGNSGIYTVTIGNIEEWQPTPPKMGVEEDAELTDELYIPDDAELGWDISRIDVKSLAQSGIEKYQYISTPRIIPAPPIDEQPQMRARMAGTAPEWKDCGEEITEVGEGIYDVEVRAVTYAGNVSEVSHYVLKNDYTPPTGTNKNDSRSIEFTAADALSGVAKISCEHGEVLGGEVICEMLKTETHVYTVTDNAGVSAEIPVEFIRPSNNGQNGSDESGPEPWVEGDEPSASIPLPVPPSPDNGALTDAAEAAQGNTNDEIGGKTVKGEDITVQPMPGGSSESIDGSSGIFARLWDALKTLFARLAELLQRLWAWFMSLPLAVRIIIFTLWWLLLAALAYYLWRKYKRERKKKADK